MTDKPTESPPAIDDDRTLVQSGDPPPTLAVGVTASPYPFLAPPQQPDELGRLGEYRVLKKLGEGANGFVFRAEDTALRRFVALKIMRPEVARHPQAADYFLREGRSLAGLKSDHVVTIYQVSVANGVPFLVMEFLEGTPLDAWIKAQAGPVPLAQVLHVVRDTLRGLAAAHEKGLIHRDIKPANLWVEQGTSRIKILDFGLTRSENVQRDIRLTADGAVVGTPSYMAPEQAAGKPVDVRADLFSVGTVFYQLLAGKNPFQRGEVLDTLKAVCFEAPPPLETARPDVPVEYAAFLDRMMAKKPAGRPADARAALAELTAVEQKLEDQARTAPTMALGPLPVVAVPAPEAAPPVWDDLTQRIDGLRTERQPLPQAAKMWLLAGGLLAGLLIAGGAIFLAGNLRGPKPKDDGPKPEAKKDDKAEPKKVEPVKPPDPIKPSDPDMIALSDDAKPNPFEKWVAEGDLGLTFQNGVATMTPGAVGWLRSPEAYTDFELDLECKFGPRVDSGIFLRAWPEGAKTGEDFVEVQILDDDRARGENGMGAVRGRAAPTARPKYQAGEWTAFNVRVVGNRVAVTVNGTKCVDAEVEFPRPSGAIGLQYKTEPVQFRRVRVRPLVNPDRAAAEFALRRGGRVVVNGTTYTDAKALPAEAFVVTHIDLGNPRAPLDDADLARFRELTGLKALDLRGPITDAGLATLAKLPSVAVIDHFTLINAEVTDDGLAAALPAFKGLAGLAVVACPRVTGAFLKGLKDNPVVTVYLGNFPVAAAELRHLRAAPNLVEVMLLDSELTDDGLKEVCELTALRALNLGGDAKLTDDGGKHLDQLKELSTIYFERAPFGKATFVALAKLPKLVAVGAHNVADRGDDDVAPFAASASVERISFQGTGITDKTLERFAACKTLKWFEVNKTQVTEEGVKKFKAARPDVELKSDFDAK